MLVRHSYAEYDETMAPISNDVLALPFGKHITSGGKDGHWPGVAAGRAQDRVLLSKALFPQGQVGEG